MSSLYKDESIYAAARRLIKEAREFRESMAAPTTPNNFSKVLYEVRDLSVADKIKKLLDQSDK